MELQDTDREEFLDELTLLAAEICRVPTAFIAISEKNRFRIKSGNGLDLRKTLQMESFCNRQKLNFFEEILIIQNDSAPDPAGAFFAAVPLIDKKGSFLGVLGISGDKSCSLTDHQISHLKLLSRQVTAQLGLIGKCEETLASARLKSAFLTNVSHEIRTPMNGIIGMTELLINSPLNTVQHQYAETIRQGSDALLTIINDILDLAKLEAGKMRFESVRFDLRETVESTVELLAPRAQKKKIEVASVIEADVPEILRGDPGRLRQVLNNLIGNAVKFTERGEIGILVKTEKTAPEKVCLRFTVTDTGVGIESENIETLFEPFVQIGNSAAIEDCPGTGLGLVISKQIVEMMNGQMGVESAIGRGSSFSFTADFGVASADDQNPAQNSPISASKVPDLFKNRRILIADGAPIIRQAIGKYCRNWGLDVTEAETGEKALEFLYEAFEKNAPFDIAVVDTSLPDYEGFSLARRIKADDRLSRIQLILTTAYGERGDGIKAAEAGISGYLTKPVRNSQLLACLTKLLEKKSDPAAPSQAKTRRQLITRHSLREAGKKASNPAMAGKRMPKILVIDDNQVNRRLILSQLEEIGLRGDSAESGVAALTLVEKNAYDLILLDCLMPEMDGFQTAREIRRREQSKRGRLKREAVIVAVTAHSLVRELEKCFTAGMNDYLVKPLRLKELSAVISFWAEKDFTDRKPDRPNLQAEKPRTNDDLEKSQKVKMIFKSPEVQPEQSDAVATLEDEFFELYLEETDRHIKEITASIKDNNCRAIAFSAHALRGNSLSMGIDDIAQISDRIEKAALENDLPAVKTLLGRFADSLNRLSLSRIVSN
ncbi:MAG: response regulator [Pyrinomonadaceae bacterium]